MRNLLFAITIMLVSLVSNLYASPYATNVIDYSGNSEAPFNNPQLALGEPDFNLIAKPWGLYSIGQYGWISLELGEPVYDIEGPDLIVWEEGGGYLSSSFKGGILRIRRRLDNDKLFSGGGKGAYRPNLH